MAEATFRSPQIKFGKPSLRTTFQLVAEIPLNGRNPNSVFLSAIKIAIDWLQSKLSQSIDGTAKNGDSFKIEVPGQQVECLSVPELNLWALRFDHPDAPFKDKPAVPGRTWHTDISLIKKKESIGLGIKVTCASLEYSKENISFTRPKIVRDIARELGLREANKITESPWKLKDESDLLSFKSFLENKKRSLPVIVLSQPDRTQPNVTKVREFVLDADYLARQALGLAHVVLMPWEIGYKWTGIVGKPWSVYLGAVKTYFPNLDFNEDPPYFHPRRKLEEILFWRHNGDIAEKAFTEFLIEKNFHFAATKRIDWNGCLFLLDLKRKKAELDKLKTTEDEDWKQTYDEQLEALNEKISELENEKNEYVDLVTEAEQERDLYFQQYKTSLWRVNQLEEAIRAGKFEDTGEEDYPGSYEDLPDWVDKNLSGRIFLHTRALKGLKKAKFEDLDLVCKALQILGIEYRSMRQGIQGGKEKFDEKLKELHLEISGSIDLSRAGQEGEQYFVRYPTANSPRQFLDSHLRNGSKKDDRYCLRIYFFWDLETQQVVIGWLPSHLDNRMT